MYLLIYILILHFIADFLLQSREVATNKSSKLSYLGEHLIILHLTISILLLPVVGLIKAVTFSLLNVLIHGVIDWYIWRVYKWNVMRQIKKAFPNGNWIEIGKLFKYYEDHWFYATIGFDQLLHVITLIVLYYQVIL